MAEIRSPDRVDGKGGAVFCIFILFFFRCGRETDKTVLCALLITVVYLLWNVCPSDVNGKKVHVSHVFMYVHTNVCMSWIFREWFN